MPCRRSLLATAALAPSPPAPPRGRNLAGAPDPQSSVGFVAGGGVDITMRILAPKLAALLGQPVVVDNRPGGAGNLANEMRCAQPPDGYTLMVATIGQMTVNPR